MDVDRRQRRGDEERDAVRLRQDRDGVGADLVRGVAVHGDPVGADDDGVEGPFLEEVPGHAVGDERDVDPLLLKLPRGEPRALQVRPGLVGEDGDALASLDRRADHAEGRAVAGRGERAGVAVREDRGRVAEELGAEAADAAVRGDVFVEHRARLGGQIPPARVNAEHPVERPHQIHRRRARRPQLLGRGGHVVAAHGRERQAERG